MRLAVGMAVLAALLAASTATAKPTPKPPSFTVEMTYFQTRDWTYNYHQVGTECSLTDTGNGSDVVRLTAKALFNLQPHRRGFAGLGAEGTHSRVGTMTHTSGTPNFPGADCGGPETTTTDPVTGCGPKLANPSFASLDLVGSKLVLAWDSSTSVPDFDCPYFAGANEASSANALPSDAYRDVVATGVDRGALLKATKRNPAIATGGEPIAKFESCANLVEPCAPGVTYDASASISTNAKFVFTPKKRRR